RERPQVMLGVRVYQIDHQLARNIGVHIPYTFNMFNIPAAALAGLGGQNIQDLINQLIASGGINQAGSSALSGLLAQLGGQQNSIFSQPLATFGGGLTFMGLSLDHLSAPLSVNESWVRNHDGVPVISNREYKGSINLRDGEPAVVAGQVSRTEQRSLSGLPGLGFLPGLNQVMTNNTLQENDDELMIIITPHVVANTIRDTLEIWIS